MATSSTLVGVASGTPDGGVAVVRLSGTAAVEIAQSLVGALPGPRRLVRRSIQLAGGAREDGLVVVMPGPGSFTGEDVVELHVHAGRRNVRGVLEACLAAGAKAAGAGDFTRRAFEHGRLTLDEAEGIAALIAAQTDEALAQARRLAGGELGRSVDVEGTAIAELRAEIEANLDFPEDVESAHVLRWREEATQILARLRAWLAGFDAGRRARERARVVLVGPPNAGKSSLFNALLGSARTIVADQPGTTRDFVEAEIEFGPHAALLVDTAGVRGDAEAVEAQGIALTLDQVATADVVLWVVASDMPAQQPPVTQATVIEIETKRDLGVRDSNRLGANLAQTGLTAEASGLTAIRRALQEWFGPTDAQPWIGLARHRDRAADAVSALERAGANLADDIALEVVAFELAIAQQRLAEIRGKSSLGPVAAEVLDLIFARFCIGK